MKLAKKSGGKKDMQDQLATRAMQVGTGSSSASSSEIQRPPAIDDGVWKEVRNWDWILSPDSRWQRLEEVRGRKRKEEKEAQEE